MDKKKFIVIAGLLLLAVVAYFVTNIDANKIELDISSDYFTISDTNAIDKIEIIDALKGVNTFYLNNKKWDLNKKYIVDKENISKFFLIFSTVQVKRVSIGNNSKELIENMEKGGIIVNIYSKNKILKSFITDDGTFSSSTCFMDSKFKKPYFVEIPSLTDNFGHIFKINESLWASKRLFSSSFRTLQSISIKQLPNKEILSIEYDKGFFKVDGVQYIDTNAIGNYLLQYRDIRFDDYVPDSLQTTFNKRFESSNYTIEVTDIDSLKSNKITLLAFNEDPRLMLGKQSKNPRVFVIAKQRLKNLIVDKASFEKR